MSVQAITWAYSQQIEQATRKFVLVTLANFADSEWKCYPSIKTICDYTGLNRKTAIDCITELETLGFIQDSGERKGATGQVKVYLLKESLKRNSSENGTVPLLPPNSPVFTTKQSQKRDTEPSGNRQGTVREDLSLVSETPTPPKPTKTKFTTPTLEEVQFHAVKIGLPEPEALKFWNYYGSQGWKVGKNPMKDWVKAIAGWKVRWETERGTRNGFTPAPAKSITQRNLEELAARTRREFPTQ